MSTSQNCQLQIAKYNDMFKFHNGTVFDRNVNEEMGCDYGPKPKIWRVYTRKRGKGKE